MEFHIINMIFIISMYIYIDNILSMDIDDDNDDDDNDYDYDDNDDYDNEFYYSMTLEV